MPPNHPKDWRVHSTKSAYAPPSPSAPTTHQKPKPSAIQSKTIKHTPYALSRVWQRVHGICPLCCGAERTRLSELFNQPTLCSVCMTAIMVPAHDYQLDTQHLRMVQYRHDESSLDDTQIAVQIASFYQYPINQLINQFKQHESVAAFLVLSALLQRLCIPAGYDATNSVIIPIPTTVNRLRQRGFNPVLMLAKSLAAHWHIPLWTGLSRHESQKQQGLDRLSRLHNVADDFYLRAVPPVRHIILFDDVVTTGATLCAVVSALRCALPDAKICAVGVSHGTAGVDGEVQSMLQMLRIADDV